MRALPLVDGLVRVAHDEEVAVAAAEDGEQLPLRLVAVLHLVHHHVLELLLPALAHGREVVEYVEGEEQQVVEVQGKVAALAEDHLRKQGHLAGELRRRDVADDVRRGCLEDGQLVQVVAHDAAPAGDAVLLQDLLHDGLHILPVEDEVVLRVAQAVDLLAQELDAETVDRGHEVAYAPAGREVRDAGAHLLRRLVGEGEAEDVGLGHAQRGREVGVTGDEGARLAGAGTRDHTDVAFGGLYGAQLVRGERFEEGLESFHIFRSIYC